MHTTQPQVYSASADEDQGFEAMPSKPRALEDQSEIFRLYSFKCPVCNLTGGPTFHGPGKWHLSVTFQGLKIPSDHLPECLEKAQNAHFYIHGMMDDEQMATFIHTADVECSHPICLANRLWAKAGQL